LGSTESSEKAWWSVGENELRSPGISKEIPSQQGIKH